VLKLLPSQRTESTVFEREVILACFNSKCRLRAALLLEMGARVSALAVVGGLDEELSQ
jgi:hypothetical protein